MTGTVVLLAGAAMAMWLAWPHLPKPRATTRARDRRPPVTPWPPTTGPRPDEPCTCTACVERLWVLPTVTPPHERTEA